MLISFTSGLATFAGMATLVLAVTPSSAQVYSTTRTNISNTTFPAGLTSFVASGFSTTADPGAGCVYVRGTSSGPFAIAEAGSGGYWQLDISRPVSVGCFGAKGNNAADDTNAINTALSIAPDVYVPCGVYLVTTLNLPSSNPQLQRHVHGAGACSLLQQAGSASSANILVIGTKGASVNGVGNTIVEGLVFNAASAKTAGAAIATFGAANLTLRNLKNVVPGNLYDGIAMDGVDYSVISNVSFRGVQHYGVAAWDGLDCGTYTPQLKQVSTTAPAGSTLLTLADATNVHKGMIVYIASLPNLNPVGVVSSEPSGNRVTISRAGYDTMSILQKWHVTFGYTCGNTNLTLQDDTLLTNSGDSNVALLGGIGGININSAHLYSATKYGLYISQDRSSGQPNREIFLNPGTDIDSNNLQGLYVNNYSLTRLVSTGAFIFASQNAGSVYIAPQFNNRNPPENGAIVQFNGGTIGYAFNYGLRWEDGGTLSVTGVNISYGVSHSVSGSNVPADGVIIASNGGGDAVINSNQIRNNTGYGVRISGNAPAGLSVIGNSFFGNQQGSQIGVIPGTTVTCTANRGGANGC